MKNKRELIKKLNRMFILSIIFMQKNKVFRNFFYNYLLRNNLCKKPNFLVLEVTNICNANCVMCPRKHLTRKVGNMDFELFKKLVNQAEKLKIPFISPIFYGEPLCNPKFIEYLEYLKNNFSGEVWMNTNASLLTAEKSKKILSLGIKHLTISIDAYSPETYKKIRGLNYKIVKKNLEETIKIKKEINSPTKIDLFFVKMNLNEKEKEKFIQYWKGKVDDITISDYSLYTKKIPDLRTDEQKNSKKNKTRFPCPKLWTDITVMVDGKVALCCQDFNGKVVVGDASKERIIDIFNGKKINAIRKMHLERKYNKIDLCQECNWYEIPNFHMALYPRIPFIKNII